MTNQHKLNLKKEVNIEYYDILEKHNALMDEWNRIALRISKMRQPKLFLFGYKKRLQDLGQELLILQKDFLNWNAKAGDFLANPHLIFTENDERELGFIHYTSLLRDMRNKLDNYMVLIAMNYNILQDLYSNRVNFIIAITSFLLTFAGLVATLIALK